MRKKGQPLIKHGFATREGDRKKTPQYRLFLCWQAMLWRCYCKTNSGYANYGGKGIRVCAEWRYSFENFKRDMSIPKEGLTLGRIDNKKGYNKGNCRWETVGQQNCNKSDTRFATVAGIRKPLRTWVKELEVSYSMVIQRIYAGWADERALCAPSRMQKRGIAA